MKMFKRILKILVRVATAAFDMFIILCVANVIIKTALDLEVLEVGAWALGVLAAVGAFTFIKFRYRLPFVNAHITPRIRPVHTEEDYKKGMKTMAQLWDAVPGTPEGDELELWAILLDDYERYHRPTIIQMPAAPQPPDPTPEPMIEAPKKNNKDVN